MKNEMPNSLRKYIRREKARIRREILDTQGQQTLIGEMYKKYHSKENDHPGNIPIGDK